MTATTNKPYLLQPPDNTTLWRFMSIEKFVDLLYRRSLYFSKISNLKDPWEGTSFLEEASQENLMADFERNEGDTATNLVLEFRQALQENREFSYASCWHANEQESAGMWDLYQADVAIKTSYKKLADALPRKVILGKVVYGNPTSNPGRIVDPLQPFCRKRSSFEHESEVRGLILNGDRKPEFENRVDIDLKIFDEVIVSPHKQSWAEEVVKSIVEKYGPLLAVRGSKLLVAPWI